MVRPKLEDPLAVTQFTQSECHQITSPVIRACLSKMGYNCNSPKQVVYGPSKLFGFGMHNYYIEQGIRQLPALVGHIRQDSETGQLIRIELQWYQVLAGTGTHLLGEPKDPIDYIETCWIMSIRDFLRTYGLQIEFTHTLTPAIQCVNDEFIMDALRVRGSCTATDLQRLNACRMWLQVARVSDISSANRRFLRKECLVGTNTATYPSSTRWPRQGRPPKTWWSLWKKKIQAVLLINGVSPTLRVPLGRWHAEMKRGNGMLSILICPVNPKFSAFSRMENTMCLVASKGLTESIRWYLLFDAGEWIDVRRMQFQQCSARAVRTANNERLPELGL
jgi:hypothetical protein